VTFFQDAIESAIERDRNSPYFKERTFKTHINRDLWSAVNAIEDPADARSFFDGYVEWLTEMHSDTPIDVARQNIGWLYGEAMASSKVAMWRNETGSYHPVFRDALTDTQQPTPQEALAAGIAWGKKLTNE